MDQEPESYYPYPYGPPPSPSSVSSVINPLEWIEPLIKNRWAFGLIVIGGLLAAFLYNLYAVPLYEASASVIFRQNIPTTPLKEKQTELQRRVDPRSELNTKVRIISSSPLLQELVKRLIDKGYFAELLKVRHYERMSLEERAQFIQTLTQRLKSGITVENPKDTTILQIYYDGPDPILDKEIVNTLADIVVEFHKNEQLMSMKDSLYFLNQQLDESRKQVEESEKKLYDYRAAHNIFENDIDKGSIGQRRTVMAMKLSDVRENRKGLEAQIIQIQDLLKRRDYLKYTALITDNHLLGQLKEQLVQSEINYQILLIKYGDKHPDVIKAEGEVAVLKKKFEQELTGVLTQLQADLEVAKSKEDFLQTSITELEQSAVASTEQDIEYVVLDRDANNARDMYNMLLGAVKEVNVSQNSIANDIIYVHERATVPKFPIKPKKPLNMLVGLIMGLILGAVYAYSREYLNQTIRTTDDVYQTANLPVLATVPLYSAKKHKRAVDLTRPLYIQYSPKSLFSEGIATLRSQLSIKMPAESPKILLLTSCAPREGKSLIAANLALSLAMNGYKTLIMDADLHHPVVHKIFGFEKRRLGLYDLVVDALNPQWSELSMDTLSLGDLQHLIRLKQWSGTIRINWDNYRPSLNISYEYGRIMGSNLQIWREAIGTQNGVPSPRNLSFAMDDTEIEHYDHREEALIQTLEFLHQYPSLNRCAYFTENVLPQYVMTSEHKNLHTMGAGSAPKNPSEILSSDQMKILLTILKERYDRVIIDTPPAWPLSDVSVLAPLIDGVLWVCRAGEIPKNMFMRTVQQVQQVQPNILGVVINAVDLQKDRYYYYGYPNYYYYRYYRSKYYGENVVEYHTKDKDQDQT